MAILFSSTCDDAEAWRAEMKKYLPETDFRVWPDDIGKVEDIDFALVWNPKPGELARYPNLKAVFSLGAGVDNILKDADLPADIPLARLVDDNLSRVMSEYVTHWVLHFHRGFHLFRLSQQNGEWRPLNPPETSVRRVGILGLGELGGSAAHALSGLGFRVAGWSRSAKRIEGVESFHGADALIPFLRRSEILVCLLPLTPATENIINDETLAALPAGAFIINAARGDLLVEDDLLKALNSGHIAAAALDVFRREPLPANHPFWRHPKVAVTPHCAAVTSPSSTARIIADNIRRVQAGRPPLHQADRTRGY